MPRADSCGRLDGRLCESLVGNIVTDAMRQLGPGFDFAITNSGGLRADLTCPTTDSPDDFCPAYTPPPFPITRGQVLGVLPFGNLVASVEGNGAELKAFLENGVSSMPAANGRFPQVSGLCFTYDISAPAGSRVTSVVRQATDGTCTGPAVDLTAAGSEGWQATPPYNFSSNGELMEFVTHANTSPPPRAIAPFVKASPSGRIPCVKVFNPASSNSCPTVVPSFP